MKAPDALLLLLTLLLATAFAAIDLSVPRQPLLLVTEHAVTLQWQPSVTPGVTYSIYRTQTTGVGYVRRANVNALTWKDTQVKSGRVYFYVVRSVKKKVESGDSNEVRVTIP